VLGWCGVNWLAQVMLQRPVSMGLKRLRTSSGDIKMMMSLIDTMVKQQDEEAAAAIRNCQAHQVEWSTRIL
jgi:hypothetical protein